MDALDSPITILVGLLVLVAAQLGLLFVKIGRGTPNDKTEPQVRRQ